MLEHASWSAYALAGASILLITKAIMYFSTSRPRLPPSPPADPIIGHARKMPTVEPYKTYAEWKKQYGDVVSATVPGRTLIILNSFVAARELLDKPIFSGRPDLPLVEVMGWAKGTPFLQYGSSLRDHRRMMQNYLNAKAMSSSTSPTTTALRSQIARLLKRLLVSPSSFQEDLRVMVSGTVVEVVYGHKIMSDDDAYIKLVDQVVRLSGEIGTIGGTIMDLIPILLYIPSWFPGMGLKRHALKTRKIIDQLLDSPFNDAKARKAAGESFSCMVADLLDDTDGVSNEQHEEDLKMAAFSVYNAGADTMKSSLSTFFLMMVLYPEVAAKAQREIDSIIGMSPERLPALEDRNKLPYVECILKEVYRINPPAPLGVPHTSPEPVQLREWTIPSGAIAKPNIWQMTRDEHIFSEPETFRPERYEVGQTESGGNASSKESGFEHGQDDPSVIVFGFGRRACPGKPFADSTLFLSFASVLAAFDIHPYKDPETGTEELPELAFEFGIINIPKPFRCTIVPRSAQHAQLVRETGDF